MSATGPELEDVTRTLVRLGESVERFGEQQRRDHDEAMKAIGAIEDRCSRIESAERARADRMTEIFQRAVRAEDLAKRAVEESDEHRGQVIGAIAAMDTRLDAQDDAIEVVRLETQTQTPKLDALLAAETKRAEEAKITQAIWAKLATIGSWLQKYWFLLAAVSAAIWWAVTRALGRVP